MDWAHTYWTVKKTVLDTGTDEILNKIRTSIGLLAF